MFQVAINKMNCDMQEGADKSKVLSELDLFVLDNSLRESTVGQIRGHTLKDKLEIYEEVKKIGFEEISVAAFSHVTRVCDTFTRELKAKGEDFSKLWAFSELVEFDESIAKDQVLDTATIPIGLRKMKKLGMKNVIIETDLVCDEIDYDKFTINVLCNLLSERMTWSRENLSKDVRVLVNLRDFSDAMKSKPERVLQLVHYLSSLPKKKRPFGIIFEEPSGKYLPGELKAWTAAVRKGMDDCGFKEGHLLAHVHEQWGLADITQLECLVGGANGIWASVIVDGAAVGHASSTVTLMNLIRLGNKVVTKKYDCAKLRKAAQKIARITTGAEPHDRQIIYGERALDMILRMPRFTSDEFSMANFFGEKPVMRISTVASPKMIVHRLKSLFGENALFTEKRAERMKELMVKDLNQNRKEEYMSKVGLALLYIRSGGQLTGKIADAIAGEKLQSLHTKRSIDKIQTMWNDDFDLEDTKNLNNKLEFQHEFSMADFFGKNAMAF